MSNAVLYINDKGKKKTAKSKIRLYCAQNYSTKNVIFLTPKPVINHLIWYMNLLPYTSGWDLIKNFEISCPELSYLSLLDKVYRGLYEREAGNKRRKISRLLALKTEKGSQAKECRLPLKLKTQRNRFSSTVSRRNARF